MNKVSSNGSQLNFDVSSSSKQSKPFEDIKHKKPPLSQAGSPKGKDQRSRSKC